MPALVRRTLGRLAIPAAGLIPPGLLGYDPRSAPAPEPARRGRAGATACAGRSSSRPPSTRLLRRVLGLRPGARERARASSDSRSGRLNKTKAEYLEADQASTDLNIGRWIADYPDADTFAYALHSEAGFLGRFCGAPELDQLAERGAPRPTRVRHSIYRESRR